MNSPEYALVERPAIELLVAMGYTYLRPDQHAALRPRENEVLFEPILVDALRRLNPIRERDALAVASQLAGLTDNQQWIAALRGGLSRKIGNRKTHQTIHLVDFERPTRNSFKVVNQLRVQGASGVRKPDLVIYLNGIPVVVIEAKSPLSTSQKNYAAIDQVLSAEQQVPRLFHSNLFNIATNDTNFLYGATGAPSAYWSRWRDPWPRREDEFATPGELGLWALLAPERLLDLLAHFIVFETRDGVTVKKMCRYQQFRAVNKMVARVVEGEHRQGLIWHTQGSGKSLTMVFAALKLKYHRGIHSERLHNPCLLVVTDRKDLDTQITNTFRACGLSNPEHAGSIEKLRSELASGSPGRTVLSTIFKFAQDVPGLRAKTRAEREAALRELALPGSEQWIVMVDECHRTQEKDLGAYLRAMLPHAVRFGFTGTPVKKNDKDTFANFGVRGEPYLDKYGIDDAVRDEATVPIHYTGRMTEWHLHGKELDVLFDQTFAHETDEKRAELIKRGVTKGDLARLDERIALIAYDIWTHYREHAMPDGFKAQIVAIDRLACVAYKKALDEKIARWLVKHEQLERDEAAHRAAAMSVCIYSPGQHDAVQHPELVVYQLDEAGERDAVKRFQNPGDPLRFLIVCNKLLTGFDAPIEQVMYLDNPLSDHNLLQAIARTNRRYGDYKKHGLIVDYIGVSDRLSEALSAYRAEDVEHAMRDLDELRDGLRIAQRDVMAMLDGLDTSGPLDQVVKRAVLECIAQEDQWFLFKAAAHRFIQAYGTLAPDPAVLPATGDVKLVRAILPYGLMHFEKEEETDYRGYSEKIRAMLDEHLEVSGLRVTVQLRSLTDPVFWQDFDQPADLHTAAVRKLSELKRITRERSAANPALYGKFSERVKKLIEEFDKGALSAAELLERAEQLARDVRAADEAHLASGLSPEVHGLFTILAEHLPEDGSHAHLLAVDTHTGLAPLHQAALDIVALYDGGTTHWHLKTETRRQLRAEVRRIARELGLREWQKRVPNLVDAYAEHHFAGAPA